jgi:predicted amidophosphoribosyltransferase
MTILLVFLWLLCGAAAFDIARKRGASVPTALFWLVMGLLFGPIGTLLSLTASSAYECPYCKRGVHKGTTRCPHCQGVLSNAQPTPGASAKFCASCGNPVRNQARFCSVCGASTSQ